MGVEGRRSLRVAVVLTYRSNGLVIPSGPFGITSQINVQARWARGLVRFRESLPRQAGLVHTDWLTAAATLGA
jgi:hypothetical protein